jgi:hypothetical protein
MSEGKELTYADYLLLDELLSLQRPRSEPPEPASLRSSPTGSMRSRKHWKRRSLKIKALTAG